MDSVNDAADRLRQQANDLYWSSAETVEQLASRLGMSRNALYSAVEPLPAGTSCESCSGMLVFSNRSSRSAGRASCAVCETVVVLDVVEPEAARGASRAAAGGNAREENDEEMEIRWERESRWNETASGVAPPASNRAVKIGGAAALGAALGATAVTLIRRKR